MRGPVVWIRPQLTQLVDAAPDGLHLDGEDLGSRPPNEREARLAGLPADAGSPLHYCQSRQCEWHFANRGYLGRAREGIKTRPLQYLFHIDNSFGRAASG